ncbi:hypothetical protein DLM45_00860 [Hyphomicrobium methylovorum]|uniref:hypothetical protein n=1 Tax=Hyphomicrobium methylovorum TaxID=84 RepID=UPI0015E6C432|nr:hypothetical protein [Hyphomicrobium methylovorum]MBA2124774.1 hypothetical protein [Hyphomicrobium methylovorum]
MQVKWGAIVLAAAGLALSVSSADARRWDHRGVCKAPLEGSATGKGILGKGSERAREAARYNWEDEAEARYGRAFANLSRARGVRWDCARNAVVTAKCVVIARPCAARISG